jgi:hypothetical protein
MSTAPRMSDGDPQQIAEALSLLDKAVLEMIRAQQPLTRVLESLCLKIEEQSAGLICSVLLLSPDGTLRDGAAPSLPASYRLAIDGIKIGPRVGSCGTAAYRQQPVVLRTLPMMLVGGLRTWPAAWSPSAGRCQFHRTMRCPELLPVTRNRARPKPSPSPTTEPPSGRNCHRASPGENRPCRRTRYRTVERLPAITYIAEVVEGRWQPVVRRSNPCSVSRRRMDVQSWFVDEPYPPGRP